MSKICCFGLKKWFFPNPHHQNYVCLSWNWSYINSMRIIFFLLPSSSLICRTLLQFWSQFKLTWEPSTTRHTVYVSYCLLNSHQSQSMWEHCQGVFTNGRALVLPIRPWPSHMVGDPSVPIPYATPNTPSAKAHCCPCIAAKGNRGTSL